MELFYQLVELQLDYYRLFQKLQQRHLRQPLDLNHLKDPLIGPENLDLQPNLILQNKKKISFLIEQNQICYNVAKLSIFSVKFIHCKNNVYCYLLEEIS